MTLSLPYARDFAVRDDVRGMQSLSTDAELLARSVDEPALFAGLYERHGLAVRRYIVRRIGNGAGDDLASEVFVRAFRARGRYRAEHDVALPWLLGIANNVIADHRRLERRRLAALERLTGEASGLVEPHDAGLAPELVAALRRLPAAERERSCSSSGVSSPRTRPPLLSVCPSARSAHG
jgi:DNA-directed RNA polymerase specialized sigma24 family protein